MLFAFAFVAAGMTPAQAHGNCASTDIQGPPVIFHGTVTNPLGPLRGATVWAQYDGQRRSTTTGTDGTYEILGRSDCAITIWSEHPTHARSADRHFDTPIAEQALPVDFQLKYLAETWVTPPAFRTSPQTLKYFVKTTAPDTGVRVPVVLPSGGTLELAIDTTAQPPAGWKQWTGTTTVSPTSDARFNYQACVLFQNATGNCNTAGAGALVSQVATSSYAYDTTPPTLGATTPANLVDVTSVPTVSATVQDPIAGVSSASLSMTIDGQSVVATVTDGIISAPVVLTPGIHNVAVAAADLAGNSTTLTFKFTLVTLTQTAANATLRTVATQVNPGNSIPPPSRVTFSAPVVDIEAFTETFNASTWTGYGSISRPFALQSTVVVFNNESGIPREVPVALPAGSAIHNVASLGESATPVSAQIPAATSKLANVAVDVPLGYNTAGSTATLKSVTRALSSTPVTTIPLIQTRIPIGQPIPVLADSIGTWSGSADGGFSLAPTSFHAHVRLPNPVSQALDEYRPLTSPSASDNYTLGAPPNVKCSGQPVVGDTADCLHGGRSLLVHQFIAVFPQDAARLYASHWLYRDASAAVYLPWHQVRSVGATTSCVNGQRIAADLLKAETSFGQNALDSSGHSSWSVQRDADQAWSGYTPAGGGQTVVRWGGNNSLDADALLPAGQVAASQPIQEDVTPGPTGAGARWSSAGLQGTYDLIVGAALHQRDPSAPELISISSNEHWEMSFIYETC